ncbi:hypothetical protein AB0D47_35710 [Streptomyces sp. NPDC048376]
MRRWTTGSASWPPSRRRPDVPAKPVTAAVVHQLALLYDDDGRGG